MSPTSWIKDALLIPEGRPYKVDSAGRIVIPSHLRDKFDVAIGDDMDYYTTFIDGRWFMCVTKKVTEEEEKKVE